MRSFLWGIVLSLTVVFSSFSQTNNAVKGVYLSADKYGSVGLDLLDNNNYYLIMEGGKYKIEGDSITLFKKDANQESFNLDFKREKNAKKIKINFSNDYYFTYYIGTQKGNGPINYQKITDIQKKNGSDSNSFEVKFGIDKADYLYLAVEGYNYETRRTRVSKYEIPKDVSEIKIIPNKNIEDKDSKGYFDKKMNRIVFNTYDQNSFTLVNEKDFVEVKEKPKVAAIENQIVLDWTYPGKPINQNNDYDSLQNTPAMDSTLAEKYSTDLNSFKFKLKIENSLAAALSVTKEAKNKFLVVYSDGKSSTAKADFDAFINDQENDLSRQMQDGYNAKYDLYNYYLVSDYDKKWLKSNKISEAGPAVLILNQDGVILASANVNLNDISYRLSNSSDLFKKVVKADAIIQFNKVVKNKKSLDNDLINAFDLVINLTSPYNYYDYDNDYDSTDPNIKDFKVLKIQADDNEVNQIWKKIIETHLNDKTTNLKLANIILNEIRDKGWTRAVFSKNKVMNTTDYLSIDYLINHFDDVDASYKVWYQENPEAFGYNNLSDIIFNALRNNKVEDENKIISVCQKLINTGKASFECQRNYFYYLLNGANANSNKQVLLLKELDNYYEKFLSDKRGNVIVALNNLFSGDDSRYFDWNSFKRYHSDLLNNTAWLTVQNPQYSDYLKKAIKWSECSLAIVKNNPYYLDTLGQLYYKDGQKEKAIATETLAVKCLNDNADDTTAEEIKNVLAKMQNGTY
ncbi:hypothetical protein [Flavobacterium ginsengiterrae]|uniref:Uncharacterized protein n=1 Tax=Flavobacterium ginsengiterrae TaxID=871695 RepID=A0ABP7GHD2_9FLAO